MKAALLLGMILLCAGCAQMLYIKMTKRSNAMLPRGSLPGAHWPRLPQSCLGMDSFAVELSAQGMSADSLACSTNGLIWCRMCKVLSRRRG
jgi:hypothetical protein